MAYQFQSIYPSDGFDFPSTEFGLIKSCFFCGLDPYEGMVHSFSTREVMVCSLRGLFEPGTLFKNLMAMLRDVVIVDTPFCPGFFQIHFSQNRFHFQANDFFFLSYEIIRLKFQKKIEKVNPGSNSKKIAIFILGEFNLIYHENKIESLELKMMRIRLLRK